MIIECINNQLVEIKIWNYQFSRFTFTDEYDQNWLLIYLRVESNLGNWQTVDPCLLTSDIKRLINWFVDILNKEKESDKEIDFLEPNLSFYLLNDLSENIKRFKIEFDLEARPKDANEEVEYFIFFEADNTKLEKIIVELKKEAKKFPER